MNKKFLKIIPIAAFILGMNSIECSAVGCKNVKVGTFCTCPNPKEPKNPLTGVCGKQGKQSGCLCNEKQNPSGVLIENEHL